jgi:Adenylate and Guanylate cyclase catalytic domain
MRAAQGAGRADRPGTRGRQPPGRQRARWRPRWLVLHAGAYLVVNGFFTVIWLLAPDVPGQGFWPAWTMLLLAVFDRPGQAIRCAAGLRERLRPIGLEIRAGLHTGEVQLRGDDVGGIGVHVAARVMAAAAPGEVLVSQTVRDLVAGSELALEDRGAHALRGMAGRWRLFAVRPLSGP